MKYKCVLCGTITLLLACCIAMPIMANDFEYSVNYGGITITGYNGPGGDVVIPAAIEGKPVTEIAAESFANCHSLTSLAIPENVATIGHQAFSGCSGLISVNIPNGVATIAFRAFYGCSSLAGINIPDSVRTIGDSAFYGCSSLANVTIRSGVTSIGNSAFSGCSSLTGITIPDSVTKLDSLAFAYCSGLANVIIENGVVRIENNVFYGCSSLTGITLPDSVTVIGSGVFNNCTALVSVAVGTGMTSLMNSAFAGCPGLSAVYFKGNVPNIGADIFHGSPAVVVYYLSGTLGWGPFFGGRPTVALNGIVATPTFNPDGGAHIGTSVNVTVSCETAGATIRYTTDGSNPAEFSETVLPGNIVSVPVPGMLRAQAYEIEMYPSEIKFVNYTLLGPSIRANGQKGTVSVSYGEPTSIAVTMAAGEYTGIHADWWVAAIPSYGSVWYALNSSMRWVEFPANNLSALRPVHQGPLMDISAPLNIPALPPMALPGTYYLYFVVDLMDGILNYPSGPILMDSVTVVVDGPDPGLELGPSIRANGQSGAVTIGRGRKVSVTLTMAAGAYAGINADWWVAAIPNYGSVWYGLNSSMRWVEFPANNLSALRPVYQGPLMNIADPVTVLPAMTLPNGVYYVYFVVDYQMDGMLNYPDGPLMMDSVMMTVK